jgi:hypothetical protein
VQKIACACDPLGMSVTERIGRMAEGCLDGIENGLDWAPSLPYVATLIIDSLDEISDHAIVALGRQLRLGPGAAHAWLLQTAKLAAVECDEPFIRERLNVISWAWGPVDFDGLEFAVKYDLLAADIPDDLKGTLTEDSLCHLLV